MKGIKGRVAIVTGGANGIGAGLAGAFARAGARGVTADVNGEGGAAAARQAGGECHFLRTDLRQDADIERLVAFTAEKFGGIDFLICAACTYSDGGMAATRAAWQAGFDVNLFGHIVLMQKALPHLQRSKWPSIVNFSSEAAHVGLRSRWVYPASKAAIEQVTRSQAMDLAEFGIRVNAVMPGWTAKPWQESASAEVKAQYAKWGDRLHMLGRLGRMEEVTDAVLFLCSEHAGFITGSCLKVDGGHSAMGPQARDEVLPTTLRKGSNAAQS
jgi:NAD(P)-dependent dehydrogenase (short-subunit alcohol dehydrogenase family)